MSNGLLPTIHQPTRVTTRTATIIDNIYTNSFEHELVGGNILINIADHMSQFLPLNKIHLDYKSCSYYEHDYSKFNETKFTDEIKNEDWSFIEAQNSDANVKFDNFYTKLSSCAGKHAPLKKVTTKQLKLKVKPWITQDIPKLMRKRDTIYKKYLTDPKNLVLYDLYKRFRNRVVSKTRFSRIQYYQTDLFPNLRNMKKLWIGIRSIVNIKYKVIVQVSQIYENSSLIKTLE